MSLSDLQDRSSFLHCTFVMACLMHCELLSQEWFGMLHMFNRQDSGFQQDSAVHLVGKVVARAMGDRGLPNFLWTPPNGLWLVNGKPEKRLCF